MNTRAKAALLLAMMVVLLAVPVAARRGERAPHGPEQGATLVVMTPHNEQIRYEFARAFERWHQRTYGEPVKVVWNNPGGTSEIRKMLVASYTAALRDGLPPGGSADVLFGGGSYEFTALARPLKVTTDGQERTTTVLEPFLLSEELLAQIYGPNEIGDRHLYDPEGYWYGAALSAFGIIYNNDVLARLGIPAPTGWEAMADARLLGWVAMVNPAQSGSVATALETILLREGWQGGWRILRRAAANARSISASAPRAPIEVSQGEAAEGLAIDFYGRFQQQAVRDGGSPGRVGYIDPIGRTTVDPDPIALLRGAPHRVLAERFILFVLSDEAQLLWQLPRGTEGGPEQFELRRMPANRQVYATHGERFIDRVNPWQVAQRMENPDPNVRDFVSPMFVAMAIDNRALLRRAWEAIVAHPEYPRDGSILSAEQARDPALRRMLEAFDALPPVPGPDGRMFSLDTSAHLAEVRAGWMRGGWRDAGLWDPEDAPADALRRIFAEFFRAKLRQVLEQGEE